MFREDLLAGKRILITGGGTGLGKAILRPMLNAADREGLPCYLENTNPANSGFYMSHGFERMEVFELGDGSPPMEAMWREA